MSKTSSTTYTLDKEHYDKLLSGAKMMVIKDKEGTLIAGTKTVAGVEVSLLHNINTDKRYLVIPRCMLAQKARKACGVVGR